MAESKLPGIMAFEMMAKAEEKPDFKVLTFECHPYSDEVLTYSDLVLKGNKLAQALKKKGIGRGDVFTILLRNHPEVVIAQYAASALGAVIVPVDPRTKGDKLIYQIKDSNSKGVIFAGEFMGNMEKVLPAIPDLKFVSVMNRDYFEGIDTSKYLGMEEILDGPEAPGLVPGQHSLNDPFMIVYTSGTTGNPKGVTSKADRFQGIAAVSKLVWQYDENDILYTGLSLSHGNANAVTMLPALTLSIPGVISRKFTKSRIWDVCRKYGCTTFSLLGGMMMGIYSEPVKPNDGDNPVIKVLSAGTPGTIWEDFEKRFNLKIHEWYGTVEGGFAHNPIGAGPIGSFGKPLEGMWEMKVVREDDTETDPGEIGELIGRLPQGKTEVEYIGNKKASEEKTRGGWLRTGDMVHKDEDGWLFFDFRKGGGLRRQGDFVIPESIEKAMAELSEVSDVCVYGVPAESGAPGESDIVAAVTAVPDQEITPKRIFESLLDSDLEKSFIPTYLQVVDKIPKTASEKNLGRLLKDDFSKDASNVFKYPDCMK